MHSESVQRRLHPRPTDSDWLVLRAMRPAIESVLERVARSGGTAVDFGCGTQPYRSIFTSRGMIYRGADLIGGDVLIDGHGHVALDAGCADLVLSFQVLEHVADVGRYLREALRLLGPGGCLLLTTHGTWPYHPHPEDHRRWTRQGLLAELATHGFDTTACIPVVGPFAYATVLRLTCATYALRRVPIAGSALAGALALLMNLRGWLEDRLTPEWVRADNACVYVTLSRVNRR